MLPITTIDNSFDYRLLEPLHALLEERHVTRAAQRCGLGQPAMSRILRHLRTLVADELLVRQNGRYERTLRADAILQALRDLMPRLQSAVFGIAFDPKTTERRFQVACTEGAAVTFIPDLVRRLRTDAPAMSLDVVPWNDATLANLESGLIDLAIGGTAEATRRFPTKPLTHDDFVCVVVVDHAIATTYVSLERYLGFEHAVLDVKNGQQPWIDDVLTARESPRRVGLRTPFLLAAVLAVRATNMIMTISRRSIAPLAAVPGLRILDAPPEFKRIEYGIAWHARASEDAAHGWLRERIVDLATTMMDRDTVE